jgi:uncharacterized protein YjiS (DUF1127 family)
MAVCKANARQRICKETAMPESDDLDLLIRNYRTLRPAQQDRVRAQLVQRARDLRAQALRGLFERFMAWRKRRAAVAQLQALDDRTLKDMGLGRGDIETAVRDGKPDRIPPASARRPSPLPPDETRQAGHGEATRIAA